MRSRNHYDDFIERDIQRDIAHHERSLAKKPQQPQKPPPPRPSAHFLSQVPGKPLTWLWPGHIPFGHLTLLDAAPGSGLSLVALTLAACVSSGSPLPDGTPPNKATSCSWPPTTPPPTPSNRASKPPVAIPPI